MRPHGAAAVTAFVRGLPCFSSNRYVSNAFQTFGFRGWIRVWGTARVGLPMPCDESHTGGGSEPHSSQRHSSRGQGSGRPRWVSGCSQVVTGLRSHLSPVCGLISAGAGSLPSSLARLLAGGHAQGGCWPAAPQQRSWLRCSSRGQSASKREVTFSSDALEVTSCPPFHHLVLRSKSRAVPYSERWGPLERGAGAVVQCRPLCRGSFRGG